MSYTTKEEILKLGEIDPELDAFLKANPPPPADNSDLEGFKAASAKRRTLLLKILGDTPPEIKLSHIKYTTTDGTQLDARLYQPVNPPKEGSPLIVYYYGGGFCLGEPLTEEFLCRNMVQAFGAVCFAPVYRLAPEFPYPQGPLDAWDSLQFAAKNATLWGADPKVGFIVGGTSAGGGLTVVLTHLARDKGLSPPLTGQHPMIPPCCDRAKLKDEYKPYMLSPEQNKDAPILPLALAETFMRGYKPDADNGELYDILNHPRGHHDLPPMFIQICGMDPLRDEAIIYERELREKYGIKTKLGMWPGLPHSFWSFMPFLKASARFRQQQVEGVGWLLGRTPDFSKVLTAPSAAMQTY